MGTSALYFSACGLQRLAQLQGIAAQHLGGGLLARPAQRNAIVCMARHHMQVKVKNGLIALAAIGLQQRQPRRVEDRLHGTGNPLGRLHDGRRLFGGDVQQGGRMAFGGQFVPRLMLPLSLTWDHRVIDGAAAARFNVYLGQILADYRRILL